MLAVTGRPTICDKDTVERQILTTETCEPEPHDPHHFPLSLLLLLLLLLPLASTGNALQQFFRPSPSLATAPWHKEMLAHIQQIQQLRVSWMKKPEDFCNCSFIILAFQLGFVFF
jgi:hypothetical protein